jgi:hypothetical protein
MKLKAWLASAYAQQPLRLPVGEDGAHVMFELVYGSNGQQIGSGCQLGEILLQE